MTVQQFRENPELVKWARETFQHENFQLALTAIAKLHPVRYMPSADVTPHFAHIQLGQQTGWQGYEDMLLSLASRYSPPQQIPEPDYPNPEPEEEEET